MAWGTLVERCRNESRVVVTYKLLVLGETDLLGRLAAADLPGCDLASARNADEAQRLLEAEPGLVLVLAAPAWGGKALATLKGVRPQIEAVLITSDRALAEGAAGLELGDLAGLLPADASAAELRAGIEAAVQRAERRSSDYPDASGPEDLLHEPRAGWLATESGDRVQMGEDWLEVLAHDLRAPLGINNGYAGVILEQVEQLDDESQELLERMRSNGEWMLGLVDGMLDVARLRHGKGALKPQPVTLNELLGSVAERMRGLAEPRGVRVEVDSPEDPTLYRVDRLRVEQVLHNLIGNAIKFSHTDAVVQVSARGDKEALTFSVKDTGCGMDSEEASRLFTKYSSRSGGRGLGLAIAREIVEMHGGRIWAESKPKYGTTFHFTIVPSPDVEPRRAQPAQA